MIVDTSTVVTPAIGGITGFAMGYVLKKLLKLAIIGVGLILAFIAFLEYKKWISVNWDIVQSQAGIFVQHSTQQILDVVNNTAHHLGHQTSVNDIPLAAGVAGFLPGLFLGLSKG